MASDGDDAEDESERSKIVDLASEKHRRAKLKLNTLEPLEIFRHIADEFKEAEVEIGPEDGHWYGPGTTDG